jgi:Ala-tRNA(Pro) deacylase
VSIEEAATPGMQALLQLLDNLGVPYQRFDHAPVFTVDQANSLLPDLPGTATKNLFLRDRKGRRHFLLVCRDDQPTDLGALAKKVGTTKLSLASPERLKEYLKIDPGSVSILALVNDDRKQVELLVERGVWESDALQAHPVVNTTTLVVPKWGLEKFIVSTGHSPKIIDNL